MAYDGDAGAGRNEPVREHNPAGRLAERYRHALALMGGVPQPAYADQLAMSSACGLICKEVAKLDAEAARTDAAIHARGHLPVGAVA